MTSKSVRVTVVGDGMVGKTCLLITYTKNIFPTQYVPTIFDTFTTDVAIADKSFNITLWDTAGQEDFERLRTLSYPNTNCFILCYSVDSKASFENITNKWYPEVNHFAPNVPVILVATKCDLRVEGSGDFVTTINGERMKNKIKAYSFIECSAKKCTGINTIFLEAINSVDNMAPIRRRFCSVL